MSSIVSIGTATPSYRIDQKDIYTFMNEVYGGTEEDSRRLKTLYERSGINSRYSSIIDYDPSQRQRSFFPATKNLEPFPSLEMRMQRYHEQAPGLAADAVYACLDGVADVKTITHLITVSCTGLAAPGLDLDLMERLQLDKSTYRTSVNFMGCYAAIHALKMADAICKTEPHAKVLIVCVELCTLHFQKKNDQDNITANAIFGDGAAAALICADSDAHEGALRLDGFYSEVHADGKRDMAWQLSGTGFLMTLSAYIPQLIEQGIAQLLENALNKFGLQKDAVDLWAVHPGGRKILDVITKELSLAPGALQASYDVLNEYGNMSSPTILFVLEQIMNARPGKGQRIFGAGFGPGLTMETFLLRA